MADEELDRTALAFARLAYRGSLKRRLVFQRPPNASENQTGYGGFPVQGTSAWVDIDSDHPIPSNFTIAQRRDPVINQQIRTATNFKVTIPRIYKTVDDEDIEIWKPVDFSTDYRAHVLEENEFNLERYFQVVGSGNDLGPDITFDAVEVQEMT